MSTRGRKRTQIPDPIAKALPDIDMRKLPSGWVKRTSKLTGEEFFEDRVTGNVTFEYPKESPISDKVLKTQRSMVDVRDDLNKMIFSNRKYVAEEEEQLAKKEQPTSETPEGKVAKKDPDADALLGWEIAVSKTTDQSYYRNLATGEGRLTFPHIPEGWSRAFSKTQKKYYYFCSKTLESVYSYPIKGENTKMSESELLRSLSTDALAVAPAAVRSQDTKDAKSEDTRVVSPPRSVKLAPDTKPTNNGVNQSADDDDDRWPDEE